MKVGAITLRAKARSSMYMPLLYSELRAAFS